IATICYLLYCFYFEFFGVAFSAHVFTFFVALIVTLESVYDTRGLPKAMQYEVSRRLDCTNKSFDSATNTA
ncbi:hypothetical protein, partial [Cycloclasticus pugetii]|uniref:hypothetical protein n=1 Tax=Cycloclasticus pugetii TaxID=34068 RepID=UPI003A922A23